MIWYISGIMLFFTCFYIAPSIISIILKEEKAKDALLAAPMLGFLFFGLSSLCFFKAGIYADYESLLGILTLISNVILLICGAILFVAAIVAVIKIFIKNPPLRKFVAAIGGFLAALKPILFAAGELSSNPLVQEKMSIALSILVAMLGLVLG